MNNQKILLLLFFAFSLTFISAQEDNATTPYPIIEQDYNEAKLKGTLVTHSLKAFKRALIFPSSHTFNYSSGIVTEMEEAFTIAEIEGKQYYAITSSFSASGVDLNQFEISSKLNELGELQLSISFPQKESQPDTQRKNYTFLIPKKYVNSLPKRELTTLYIQASYKGKRPDPKKEKSKKTFATVK